MRKVLTQLFPSRGSGVGFGALLPCQALLT